VTTRARLDHLVVMARTLDEGAQWCESVLGVTPGPGGAHPLMRTHNRLLRIATVNFPCAYLEIIAPDPSAPVDAAARTRWFDMDDAALQASVRQGPRLIHWVAQVPDARACVQALAAQGIDRGEVLAASRMTPRGLLQWEITVRPDGQRLFDGCLPTLIQWGDTHPVGAMADAGLTLQALTVSHPQAAELRTALATVGLDNVTVQAGEPRLCVQLMTPRGRVKLESKG
jgi:hypothetical protein